jgi:uncharacterized protein (TIGR04255 family)
MNFNQDFYNFFSKIEIQVPDLGANAIIIQQPSPTRVPDSITLILDIDVFRAERLLAELSTIWETLDKLREVKNMIFEAWLSTRTKELFR